MDEFASILHRDYGLRPQGKSAPMSSAKSGVGAGSIPSFSPPPASNRSSSSSTANFTNGATQTSSLRTATAPNLADDLLFFGAGTAPQASGKSTFASASADLLGGSSAAAFGDVFGGPPSYTPAPSSHSFDDVFRPTPQSSSSSTSNKNSSLPVFDAPLYDDDIFGGVPGIRSAGYDDIFNLGSKTTEPNGPGFDDLLGGFSSFKSKDNAANSKTDKSQMSSSANLAFDELLPGFGGTEPAKPGSSEDDSSLRKKSSEQVNGAVADDPFTVFESSGMTSTAPTSSISGIDPFGFSVDGFNMNRKSSSSIGLSDGVELESSPLPDPIAADASNKSYNAASNFGMKEDTSSPASSPTRTEAARESKEGSSIQGNQRASSSFREHRRISPNAEKSDSDVANKDTEAGSTSFRGNVSTSSSESMPGSESMPERYTSSRSRQVPHEPSPNHKKVEAPLSNGHKARNVEDFWITIEDVKLVTQPTSAPPPSRQPPAPRPKQSSTSRRTGDVKSNMDQDSTKQNKFSTTQEGVLPETSGEGGLSSSASIFDGFEEFAAGGGRSHKDVKSSNTSPSTVEEDQTEGSAAATASGAAVREAIERAEAKLRQVKEAKDREREELKDSRDREERDKSRESQEKGDDGEGRERERLHRERETRERRRAEREKEKEKEREREREKDRIAVEKANEARERAAVERAAAEARERAVAKAAERAAVERATSEARARAERAAVERATAEARERAAAEAREKKAAAERAAAARERQQRNGDDLEAFFMSSTRPASAPRQRTQNTDAPAESQWKSVNLTSNVKKVPSASSMTDDLASIFGGPAATTSEFQEIEGESEERRRHRLERIQRTHERAAKALEEKHQRDLLSQKEQAERHRAGELVDAEIKRWAAGKEGNLRALLSTLQYVLWPECGWQPVSLTDLITAAAVKKVYRKATLYVHPDKVQQKGATVQQKYIAEKVFDLLKEAWNKFNSEELF